MWWWWCLGRWGRVGGAHGRECGMGWSLPDRGSSQELIEAWRTGVERNPLADIRHVITNTHSHDAHAHGTDTHTQFYTSE